MQPNSFPAYLTLAAGAAARLAYLKRAAGSQDWRAARHWGYHNAAAAYCTLDRGAQDDEPVYYTHCGPEWPERFADEIIGLHHTGWYTDGEFARETARGIVARLPHGRWLAGYLWSGNGERVYWPIVHDSERDAAHAADEHARVMAERESAYQGWQAAHRLQDDIADELQELAKALALRHHKRLGAVARADAERSIRKIRRMRRELATEYKDAIAEGRRIEAEHYARCKEFT